MATVSETLALYDGFTPVLRNIQQALNLTLNGFERMQSAADRNVKVQEFELARQKINNVGAEIRKVEEEQEKLNRTTNNYSETVNKMSFSKLGMGITFLNQGLELAERVIQKISGFMSMSDEASMINSRIGMMNDGLLAHHELQKQILQSANATRSSYANTVDLMNKLSFSGGFNTTQDMMDFSETINKSIRLGGGTKVMNDSAMLQLSQALGSGRLQGDELRSLSENAPFLMKALADGLGVSRGQLKQLGADGELTTTKIIEAFQNQADAIDELFNGIPVTWGDNMTILQNKWTNFMQHLSNPGGVLEPLINKFNELIAWIDTANGQTFMLGVATGIEWIVTGLLMLGNVMGWVADLFLSNWDLISLGLVITAALLAGMFIPALWAMVPPLLAQAGAWLVMNWPIVMIVAAIAMFIGMLHASGVTTEQVIGIITGLFFGLYAFIYNIVADLWNLIAVFMEFFANVWDDPIGSIARLFIGLADTVLGVLETIANGIDAVFGSNLSSAVSGWRNNMQAWSDENIGEAKVKIDRMDKMDVGASFGKGYEVGVDFANGATSIFDDLKTSMDSFGLGSDLDINSVGKIKSPVEISSEDLKVMRELAEAQAIQNFVSLTPNIQITTGDIKTDDDFDTLMTKINAKLEMEMEASVKGVYDVD